MVTQPVKKTKAAVRKKVWMEIVAPALFNGQSLGETCLYEPQEVIGRVSTVNLSVLTRDPKKQNINVSFRATQISQGKAQTELYKYLLMSTSIRRMARRGKSKIDDSFVAISADGKRVRVKPLMITRTKVSKSLQTALRMGFRAQAIKQLRKMSVADFFKAVIMSKIQREIHDALKKVYPLGICEVRHLEVLPGEATPLPPEAAEPETPQSEGKPETPQPEEKPAEEASAE
ncbi:hypothetical protein J4457_00750 [Candidatus Woesearchaeota archaeon]|nr:hypothetical protein [Candidatus Woesearchaeota archaeon]